MNRTYNDAIKEAADMYAYIWDNCEQDKNGDLLNQFDAIKLDAWLSGICDGLCLGFNKCPFDVREDMLTAIYKKGY